MRTIKRGDIFYADLSPAIGSEQGGTRPVLIVQNDVGNYHSPTVIVAILTSKSKKNFLLISAFIQVKVILQWILRFYWSKYERLISFGYKNMLVAFPMIQWIVLTGPC